MTVITFQKGCSKYHRVMLISAMLFQLVATEVSLQEIVQGPRTYEGQTVETCGEIAQALNILWVSPQTSYSRLGIKLHRFLDEQGYVCLRAKVIRALPDPTPERGARLYHVPAVPNGWQLQVSEVVRRR
jgi:hypothetical protein